MLGPLLRGAAAALFASAAFAQHAARVAPVDGLVRDAGVYHVATGTWTRSRAETAALGSLTIYRNDAFSGYFALHADSEIWFDTARIPGAGDPSLPGAIYDAYVVDGCEVGYCSSEGPAGVGARIECYEAMTSCIDPTRFPVLSSFTISGLPGSSAVGVRACWVVTLDLAGTSLVQVVRGDGGDGYDGELGRDSFGFSFSMTSTAGGYAGPLLAGDPRNFPYGDGTYYQNPSATGSGLGIQDQFYLIDTGGVLANGCYWFGSAPFVAWWLTLHGSPTVESCVPICASTPSSTGLPGRITTDVLGETIAHLVAEPVPDDVGIFCHAPTSTQVPFGDGYLCVGREVVRTFPPEVAAGGRAELELDVTGLVGRRYFQYWFRDPATVGAGGAGFNLTDAVCCDFGS